MPLAPHYFKSASPRRGHVAIHSASLPVPEEPGARPAVGPLKLLLEAHVSQLVRGPDGVTAALVQGIVVSSPKLTPDSGIIPGYIFLHHPPTC